MTLPTAPGLGYEIEWDYIRDNALTSDREPALAGYSAVGLSKRGFDGVREAAMAELAASLPPPHSFGRRGR